MKKLDLIGQRYGRLTVIKRAKAMRRGNVIWICRCDCDAGEKKRKRVRVYHGNLRAGKTRSCGCLASEGATARGARLRLISRRRLSAEEVDTICRLAFEEDCTIARIAERIGVSSTSVFKVLNGLSHEDKTGHWLARYRNHNLFNTHRQREARLNALEGYDPSRVGSARNT